MITSTTSTTKPNIDTTLAGAASAAAPGGAMGKDQFLKLLIAQLQNQDPMSPMQGDQMAAQLAQFSSLEQLQQINATLTSQQSASGSLLGAMQAGAAINTIGHSIVATGNAVQVGGANGATSVTVDVPTAAKSATLHIYNASGVEVGTESLGGINAGNRQTFSIGSATKGLPDGAYTYSIDATDSNGSPVTVQTYTSGRVDGISSGPNGVVLNIGGVSIPYTNVVQVN